MQIDPGQVTEGAHTASSSKKYFDDDYERYSLPSVPIEKGVWGAREVMRVDGTQSGSVSKTILGNGRFPSSFFSLSSVGGSIGGGTDTDGNSDVTAEGHFNSRDDDGNNTSASVSISGRRDSDGNISGEFRAEIKYEHEF